ncbi:hypothetical protein MPTK1_5g03340 [Marchantia polymorpha subsp. ruderalis]|uniref:Uncharacterized protein n=2 Tax=Marchantia polymorpha TaxID=3197 RepID=A0AAF6BEH6_MARPO|nr:hypothetical protein MARPO_0133s0053 [Marchantia polymorpha]PTQ29914.1 hypothetical protein MARPO_0133s0053 [Marchantia polymorpha]BBN10409.1 hypothetical protein Mp_5g03340 [Marchantia polymorpha subsp. ruderalis]BBN10410.1 hypothetical protein Mp_5g03340 [Marchantia polymorpha subsp. ruderalis]|eukprot:PTQ29913.1 hypothetical protein MARPO_0133s0053 [Marchantia polymorpha]
MGIEGTDILEAQVAKCNCPLGNDTHSLASNGTPKPSIDWLHYCTNSSFKPEDYVQDAQVIRLHLAARDNNTSSIKKILAKGVSVSVPDEVGRSALHWAAVFCKLETVEAIIKRFPASLLDKGDRSGCTPLHYAVLAGRADVAGMLLKAGCNVHAIDNQGRTPLHYAAQNSNLAVVAVLLRRGANPTLVDKLKRLPYDVAVEYNNIKKILECLRLEPLNAMVASDKMKPVEHRQKQPMLWKAKVNESHGKVPLAFISDDYLQAEKNWQAEVSGTDEEQDIVDRPVEIVKEQMERDADKMKHKLRKIEQTKKGSSEEQIRVQQKALKMLLDRAKKTAMEQRRQKWAEEERVRRIAQSRTRTMTPFTISNSRSSLGMRTPTGFSVRHFQTSRRPSGASSSPCRTEEIEPDSEGSERPGIWDASYLALGNYFQALPSPELRTGIETEMYTTEMQAPERAPQQTATAIRDSPTDANVQQEQEQEQEQDQNQILRDQPQTEDENANASCPYLQQWIANAFSYPAVPPVMCQALNPDAPPYTGDLHAEQSGRGPTFVPPEQRNFMVYSVPKTYTEENNVPSVVPNSNAGQASLRGPPPDYQQLFFQHDRSRASGEWKVNEILNGPIMDTEAGASPEESPSNPSAPYDGENQTEIRPSYEDEPPLTEYRDGEVESPDRSTIARAHNERDRSNQNQEPNGNSSLEVRGTEGNEYTDEDEDPFTRLGFLHSHKVPKGSFCGPPNRHGIDCYTRPKARSQAGRVRVVADYRWAHTQAQPKNSWSPDEPWRPGGISKTLEHCKTYGSLRTQCKRNSIHSIRALIRRMQTKPLDDAEIDADPFERKGAKWDDETDAVSMVEPQDEALWSLRERSRRCSDSSDVNNSAHPQQPRLVPKRQAMKYSQSHRANNVTSRYLPETCPHRKLAENDLKAPEYVDLTGRTYQEPLAIADQLQPTSDEFLPPCTANTFDQCNIHPLSQSQSNPTYPESSSWQQSDTSLSYRPHRYPENSAESQAEFSPHLRSNQQAEGFSDSSTSFQLPRAAASFPKHSGAQLHTMTPSYQTQFPHSGTISSRPASWDPSSPEMLATWLDQKPEDILLEESQQDANVRDEFENRVPRTSYTSSFEEIVYQEDEIERDRRKFRASKPRSHSSVKRADFRCSLERISPERLALMEYYGQSVRPRFLGLGREQPPVHQCLDIELLQRQWL